MAEPAAVGVLQAAAERSADVIVVGTRGATKWQRLLVGSTAARLVREAPCPVLLARRGVRPGALAPPEALTRFSWSGGG